MYRLAERIRLNHDGNLAVEFDNLSQKRYDDHPANFHGVEFNQVEKSEDLVVTVGVNQIIDQILGVSTTRWQYLGRGIGTTAPTAADTILQTEVGLRLDMSVNGWREQAGATLRFAGIFGETYASGTHTEAGIFTALSAGIMLNRVMFSNNSMNFGNTHASVISCIIEFVPIVGT